MVVERESRSGVWVREAGVEGKGTEQRENGITVIHRTKAREVKLVCVVPLGEWMDR